jgi:hypothetical protein
VFARDGNSDRAIAQFGRKVAAGGRHPAFAIDKATGGDQFVGSAKEFVSF